MGKIFYDFILLIFQKEIGKGIIKNKLKKIKFLYSSFRANILILTNYLFVLYAFILPIDYKITRNIFTIILILFIMHGDYWNKIKFAFKDKVVQSLILFFLMHIIWMYGSEHMDTANFKLHEFRYVLYIMIYITMIRQDYVYKIISAFLFSMFVSELTSYLISFQVIDPIRFAKVNNPVPFMLSHIQYSSILAISLGIILYITLKERRNMILKTLYILFFFSATINMFIINSRMGYVLYAISISVVILLLYKKNIFKVVISIFLLICISYTFAYNTSKTFNNRIHQMLNGIHNLIDSNDYTSSVATRIGYYGYSWDIIKNNFLFGVGTGDHIEEVLEAINQDQKIKPSNYKSMSIPLSSGYNANLHSEYLDIAVQFGLIGLIIFLNIFYQLFRYKQEDLYLKAIQYILVFVGLVISIPSVIFLYATVGKVFTLLAALTLTMYYGKDGKPIMEKI